MKCPYCLHIEQVYQDAYAYTDDGQVDVHAHKLVEDRPMPDCLREECGAWHDGRCHYYGE